MKQYHTKSVITLTTILLMNLTLFAGGATEDTAPAAAPVLPEGHILNLWEGSRDQGNWKITIEQDGTITLADNMDTHLPLTRKGRIVITSGGAIETFYMLNAEDIIAAIGTSSGGIWPEEKTAQLETVGNLARPSFEKILAAEPDLVLLNGMNTELYSQLSALGIPVILHNPGSIREIINSILVIGILTDREKQARELVQERRETLKRIQQDLNASPLELKGAFVYALEPVQAFSAQSLPGEILKTLGVINIAENTTGERPILTTEYILQQNPDFIFGAMSINTTEDILNADAAILKTRAGREKNIFIVPSQLILRPSPRIIDALSSLQQQLRKIATVSD